MTETKDYCIRKAVEPYAGRWWVIETTTTGSVDTDRRIGYVEKLDNGLWMPWMIGAKYGMGPGRKTRREAREAIVIKHNAPTREESLTAELAKIRSEDAPPLPALPPKWSAPLTGPVTRPIPIPGSGTADAPYVVPACGPEREDCRCAARIRGREHRTIHDLYPVGECPDNCHATGWEVEDGTKFNQFDITQLAAAVVNASYFGSRDSDWAIAVLDAWCKVTGLPRQRAIMVAAEIHNRATPTIAIVSPF